jgi:hypothetical protein
MAADVGDSAVEGRLVVEKMFLWGASAKVHIEQ